MERFQSSSNAKNKQTMFKDGRVYEFASGRFLAYQGIDEAIQSLPVGDDGMRDFLDVPPGTPPLTPELEALVEELAYDAIAMMEE